MSEVVIIAARRTATGAFWARLRSIPPLTWEAGSFRRS